jgi:hypothetical protein
VLLTYIICKSVFRLNVVDVRTEEEFLPHIQYVKEHCVFITPFLNVTERMEELHEKPYRTDRPEENKVRSIDYVWHQPKDVDKRPPLPPIGSLYNGFAVHMQGEKNVYLVYGNERHTFKSDASMKTMGFDYDSVLVFKYNHLHPVPHRIMDNIPLGADVPEEGVIVRITPSYVLRPLK